MTKELRARGLLRVAIAVAAAAVLVPASASAATFSHQVKLPNSTPQGDLPGWEPSVAFDPGGHWTYVVAPGGGDVGGIGFWRSPDGGRTWENGNDIGMVPPLGGGDSDVSVGPDHTVYATDLELVANALCRSYDHGETWTDGCNTGVASNQTGLESDREWVNPDPHDPDIVYFSYHDFVAEIPLVYKSTSGGDPLSFIPCGPVLEPGGEAFLNFVPGGTDQGKMLTAQDGSLYVPITEPTNPGTYLDPYNNFYIAYARDGCDSSTNFKNVTVYSNPNANLANIFSYVVEDGGGNIYALTTGSDGKHGDHNAALLFVSKNRARTWTNPIAVERPGFKASALGAVAGGPEAGDVAVGFFATRTSEDPSSEDNVWRYYVALSHNYGRTFDITQITKNPIHYGAICNLGILCTSGRNLLDFSSVDVNPHTGCVIAVFPGDPFDKATHEEFPAAPYVSRQTSGCF
jgi:hypothetical protein